MARSLAWFPTLALLAAPSCRKTHAPSSPTHLDASRVAVPRPKGPDRFANDNEALTIAARYLPENPVILEAGAFHGETTTAMAQRWPEATVYAFEPVPQLFAIVKRNTTGFPHVHASDLALSDKVGTAVFHVSTMAGQPDTPIGSSSLLEPSRHREAFPWVKFDKEITVSTTTIDAWARREGVKKIDFIWLDVQGYEYPILKASPAILKTVKAMMTEMEFAELYKSQALLAEIEAWLDAQGFSLVATDFAADAPTRTNLKNRSPSSWYGNGIFVRKPSGS